MKNIINIKNFWGFSIVLLLYVNFLFELKSNYLSFKISEITIITVLLFVLILIFNEINTNLFLNFAERNIKYNKQVNFIPYSILNQDNDLIKSFSNLKQIYKINIKKVSNYKLLLSLI